MSYVEGRNDYVVVYCKCWWPVCTGCCSVVCYFVQLRAQQCTHHATRQNTTIHNILSTAPQLSISQKALGTLPEDGNVMPKHVGATVYN
jgi:hypothetical protein